MQSDKVSCLKTLINTIISTFTDIQEFGSLSTVVVNEKSYPGEDNICSLLFDVQSEKNSSSKVVKVSKAKSVAFDDLDEVVSSF